MKIRHIKVSGDVATPLPDSKSDKATHSISLSNAKYDLYTSSKYFKVVEGFPMEKTEEELDAQEISGQKENAKKDCDLLYKDLRRNFNVADGEIYEFDIEALLLFDSQVKNKASDIKVKEKGKKIKAMTKSKSTSLMNGVNIYLESLSDAYNLDWDLIESEDYTLPNLTALKEAQEAI